MEKFAPVKRSEDGQPVRYLIVDDSVFARKNLARMVETFGGQVIGEVRAKAASPDASAIDWLLLSAKSANGAGVLGTVSYVQRLNTVGGQAPASDCSGANAGEETRVPYSAEYDFYGAR